MALSVDVLTVLVPAGRTQARVRRSWSPLARSRGIGPDSNPTGAKSRKQQRRKTKTPAKPENRERLARLEKFRCIAQDRQGGCRYFTLSTLATLWPSNELSNGSEAVFRYRLLDRCKSSSTKWGRPALERRSSGAVRRAQEGRRTKPRFVPPFLVEGRHVRGLVPTPFLFIYAHGPSMMRYRIRV